MPFNQMYKYFLEHNFNYFQFCTSLHVQIHNCLKFQIKMKISNAKYVQEQKSVKIICQFQYTSYVFFNKLSKPNKMYLDD